MKKVTLTFNGSRFDIDLEENFAHYLEQQMAKDFNVEGNNDMKLLLQAYVSRSYELFEQEKSIQQLLQKIENQ